MGVGLSAAIYLGMVNNRQLPRFVRFNAVQAIMLDVLLIFPSMVEYAFGVPRYGMALTLYGAAHSVVRSHPLTTICGRTRVIQTAGL